MGARPVPLPARRLPPQRRIELTTYQRARRYAVPGWMIDAATERRLAGDPAGACAAAYVDIDIDLARIASAYGPQIGAQLADDLRHLAPDLLRWHFPRVLAPPGVPWASPYGILERYGGPRGAMLMVCRSRPPSQLKLWVRSNPERGPHYYDLHRAYWDARHTDALRIRCGGVDRVPFFHPDGRPRDVDELPDGPRPDDPAAHTEWVAMLLDHGRSAEALAACGITLGDGAPDDWPPWRIVAVERLVADAAAVLATASPQSGRRAVVRIDGRGPIPGPDLDLTLEASGTATVRPGDTSSHPNVLMLPEYRRPVDFDLLRFGYLQPDDLHPLVRSALFPDREPATGSGPPPPSRPVPARVPCRGARHLITHTDGRLVVPHPPEEIEREAVMAALGAPQSGCFQAVATWRSGGRALAKGLARQRTELMDRAFHGDSPGVTALLDAGLDPFARNENGQTLLHLLSGLDHEVLLPRLLAAGLDVNAVDGNGHTPLHAAGSQHYIDVRTVTNRRVAELAGRLSQAGGVDGCRRMGYTCRVADRTW